MANTLKLKRSSVASKVPLTTDLQLGELAVNTYDGKLYTKKNAGSDVIVDLSGSVTSVGISGGSTGLTTSGGPITTSGTITLAGTLAIANGGTGATTATAAANALDGYLTIATSAGTTTLTASSARTITLTGTNTHTIQLPDVTTLQLGWQYNIVNLSTQAVTVNSSGGNAFSQTITAGMIANLICIAITGTTTASWALSYTGSTTRTGFGNIVYSSSAALTTPNLGTPSAATLTNATGLPLSTGVTGTLSLTNGGTGATTQAGAANSILPSQTGNSGKYLTTNGTDVSWATVAGGGASVTISDTAPVSPTAGNLWWNSSEGQMYIYYNDGNTSQWVIANAFIGGAAYLPLTGGNVSGDIIMTGTGQLELPAGTTAQRSGSPSAGMVRYNTTLGRFEGYGTSWGAISTPTTMTVKNSTSGTVVDFTDIPSGASRVTVMMNNVSTSGTSVPLVQLGTSGGFETSGYNSVGNTMNATALGSVAYTAGFGLKNLSAAAEAMFGSLIFSHMGGNVWTLQGMGRISGGAFIFLAAGSKSLAGTLDRIRITTVNGTDTFDAGTINVMWE